jgi:hypothetical protein
VSNIADIFFNVKCLPMIRNSEIFSAFSFHYVTEDFVTT